MWRHSHQRYIVDVSVASRQTVATETEGPASSNTFRGHLVGLGYERKDLGMRRNSTITTLPCPGPNRSEGNQDQVSPIRRDVRSHSALAGLVLQHVVLQLARSEVKASGCRSSYLDPLHASDREFEVPSAYNTRNGAEAG